MKMKQVQSKYSTTGSSVMMKREGEEELCYSEARKTALVVDDNKINQMIHRKLLNDLGIENEVVENGKEAVDIHISDRKFDLILMDMDMPVMNGIQATKQLRAMGIHSMIVGVSSHSLEHEKQEFIDAGLDDYHEKPLTVTKLVSLLRKVHR